MKNSYNYSSVFKIRSHGLVSLVVSGMLAITISYAAPASNALPTGGAVVSGNVNISTNAATMNINQASSKSVINWNSYNIGSAATVNYNFAQSGSSSLNRVLSNNPSEIYGRLNANGKVILVNPNGIVFGSGSSVNVGSIVATTMNIKDADYLDGKMIFTRDGSIGKILNEGTITAEDRGYIALLAPEVVNKGVLKATMGTISLAAGDKVELTLDGSGLKTIIVEPSTIQTLIENKSLISASGGNIYLGAKQASVLLDTVMNLKNSGNLEATAMNSVDGKIVLDGDNIEVDGTLKATSIYAGNKNNAKTIVKATATLEGEFVETSGKVLGIENGAKIKAKTWLLDPVDVTIDSGSSAIGGATVGASVIQTALGSGNIQITADNNIMVNSAISWNINSLTLSAGNNINVNADLVATGAASLAFNYGQATANGGTSTYTVADGVKILIPNANNFSWKKGSAGAVNGLVFDNDYLRFGDGSSASIDSSTGMLLQPWYKDGGSWYPLTFSNYPLDMMIGVGGSGYNDGYLYSTADGNFNLSNFSINIAKYKEKTGTISTSGTLTTALGDIGITHDYALSAGTTYLKTDTAMTNNSNAAIPNARMWVGTQDDWIVNEDSNYKTRGNLGGTGFTAVGDQAADAAKALIVSDSPLGGNSGIGVLFYSITDGTNVIVGDGYGWQYIKNANPTSMANYSQSPADGSYAMYLNAGSLPANGSQSVTWYYAAAPVANITTTAATSVAQSSGAATPSSPIVTYVLPSTATATYGSAYTLPTPTFTGGTPTGTATVKVYDANNNDVTSQATAGTLSAGVYTVKVSAISDAGFTLASSGNTTGSLTISKSNITYVLPSTSSLAVGSAYTLPTPTFTGGTPTATATVKVYDANNNDVTSQATAGTLLAGTYTVKTLLTDTNYQIASNGNTAGTLVVGTPQVQITLPTVPTVSPTQNKTVETIVSKIADNAAKTVGDSVKVNDTKTPIVLTANTQNSIQTPSVVQVLSNPNTTPSNANMGAIETKGGITNISLAVSANANPFSNNTNISVLDGGVKLASVELPSNTATEVKSDVRASGIISSTPISMVVVKQLATQKGVELAIVAPSSNITESKVVAKIAADSANNFSFAVKEAVNINVAQKDIKEIKATLDNGQALPSWLKFDVQTQTFKAINPPADALPISTKISITTKAGQTQQVAVDISK